MRNAVPAIIIIASLLFLTACTAQTSQEPASPSASAPSASEIAAADSCTDDSDCVCSGIDPFQEKCFLGNRQYYDKYVDKSKDCPDFCTGIAGNLVTRCVDSRCMQVYACLTPADCGDGESCVHNRCTSSSQQANTAPSNCKSDSDCTVGGCSGQVCQPKSEEPVVTTCEFRSQYACYKDARCGCIGSRCAWDYTPELKGCVEKAGLAEKAGTPV